MLYTNVKKPVCTLGSTHPLLSDLSPCVKDLIFKLLQKNPAHRIRLNQILDHPFMSNQRLGPPRADAKKGENVCQSLAL